MRHVVVIPERFCLGDAISFKARRVAAIEADRLTVCCPVAWRFLYPTATEFVDVPETLDGYGERKLVAELKLVHPQAEFVRVERKMPEKHDLEVEVQPSAIRCDVMVVPRKKDTSSPHRNWSGWRELTDSLVGGGRTVVSAGRKDMSFDCGVSHLDKLDEIAAVMKSCRFVVSTDSGLAHLAILLRVPLIVLWGSPVGVIPGQDYRKGCHGRMEAQKKSPVYHIEGAWGNVQHAVSEVLRITA